jgi:creatinine amidohydrolase
MGMMQDTTGKSPGAWVAALAWPEVEQRMRAAATAILPVGAGAKEHGRHLPLNTDQVLAEWLTQRLIERSNVLAWPTLTYGHYPAFVEYPGSCNLSAETFEMLVDETLSSIMSAGVSNVLILNTGISTVHSIERIAAKKKRAKRAHVYQGTRYRELEQKIRQQAYGSHADELETSIMLAIAPDKVNLQVARSWAAREMQPGPLIRKDFSHPNYSPDGVYGDPTLATEAKGRRLLEAMLQDILSQL